eukprot:4740743-Amphidinium_carterae.1
MQSGRPTWRSGATRRDEQEACPLLSLQTLGESGEPTYYREGPGGPFSASTSRSAQEAESFYSLQGAAGARPAFQADSPGSQTYCLSGQATGVACGPADKGPTTQKR